MKYYVVSDIHGFYTLLQEALEQAGFFAETEPCVLVVCGDLLDRGTQANELVAFLLEQMELGRLIYVRGNHEDLLVQCLQEIAHGGVSEIAGGMSHHFRNKTWDSLLQLSGMCAQEACACAEELVRRVMHTPFYTRLLPACVDYYETPHYIFTHGWLPCVEKGSYPTRRYAYRADWREADGAAWRKARWLNGMELCCKHHVIEPQKTVVCGHFHTSYGHACIDCACSEWGEDAIFLPYRAEGLWAIDACAAVSGSINCIVIED